MHRGPTTSVWLGRTAAGQLVATKVLHPDADRGARRRLAAQARRAKAAGGAAVLAPVRARFARGDAATVWPWVPGRDLAGRIDRHGRPEPPWARSLAADLDSAVDSLHQRGLVHGRLTADHVLIDRDGRPRLIGLHPTARATDDTRASDRAAVQAICDTLDGGSDDCSLSRSPLGPPAVLNGRGRRSGRRWALAAGLAVTVVGGGVGLARATSPAACPLPSDDEELRADVDGDGCHDRLEWSGTTGRLVAQTAEGRRAWALGEPGDHFVLGDWDCDGSLTPGLRRVSTGRTYGFDAWPTAGTSPARPVDDPPRCAPDP